MYAACADAVNDSYPNALHVLSHMLGMSIELSLKAYLRLQGLSVKELRSLGHDLVESYNQGVKFGLTETGSRGFVMRVLSALYEKRAFAYPEEAVLGVIMPWRLRQMANELIDEVFPLVHPDVAVDSAAVARARYTLFLSRGSFGKCLGNGPAAKGYRR
jgi:hypothetical protein